MRGKQVKKRKAIPDAKYSSIFVAKLINNVMNAGKKALAEKIVYTAMDNVGKAVKKEPLEALENAIENVKPKLEVRPRRVGGVNYQVPTPVPEHRQLFLALKWIVTGARSRRTKEDFIKALTDELIDAYNKTGFAMKKKEDAQKMAEANKAFAHFSW